MLKESILSMQILLHTCWFSNMLSKNLWFDARLHNLLLIVIN